MLLCRLFIQSCRPRPSEPDPGIISVTSGPASADPADIQADDQSSLVEGCFASRAVAAIGVAVWRRRQEILAIPAVTHRTLRFSRCKLVLSAPGASQG